MAGVILKQRVGASSLVEVTTALIIVSLVFSLGIGIYLNIQRSGLSTAKVTYEMLLDDIPISDEDLDKGDTEIQFENVVAYRSVLKHPSNPELYIVHLALHSADGKLLAERKHLRYVPKD